MLLLADDPPATLTQMLIESRKAGLKPNQDAPECQVYEKDKFEDIKRFVTY